MINDIVKPINVYNPDTGEELKDRVIFGGNPPGDLDFNNVRHKWAISLLELMQANTWFTSEVSLISDKKDYPNLTDAEKNMFDLSFSLVIFLDTLQTGNIPDNIIPYISSPEVRAALTRQTWEETLHSISYATVADTISPTSNEVFVKYKTDEMLRKKNDFVAAGASKVKENRTEENMLLSFYYNQALEGIYFKSAFAAFYSLARHGRMKGTAKMISFIERDENTHLFLFKNMIKSTYREKPYLRNPDTDEKARNILREAAELEMSWATYITNDQILGLSSKIMSDRIKFLANEISEGTGLGKLYPEVDKDPMPWVNDFTTGEGIEVKGNFFEANVSEYSVGTLSLDDI